MFSATDPLHVRPRRVLVAGVTGAGKSTLARALAGASGIPYTEIDALYHGPGWTPRPTFLGDVAALAAGESWVTEWQYRSARDILEPRADTLVWLDFPVRTWLPRLARRTIRRRLGHVRLWAGNVEPPLWHFVTGRDHVLAWALRSSRGYRQSIPDLSRSHPGLQVVRLRSPRDARRWLDSAL